MPDNKKLTEFKRIKLAFMITNVILSIAVIAIAIMVGK